MHDCISSNPLCFFDFRGLFLHFLLEYPPNFSPKFFGYTPKLFGYPEKTGTFQAKENKKRLPGKGTEEPGNELPSLWQA